MADNTFEKTVDESAVNESEIIKPEVVKPEAVTPDPVIPDAVKPTEAISQPQPEINVPAPKKKPKALIAVIATLLILGILAGGGFLGIRLYETQNLSQAKSALQAGSWAAAETAAEKALALQPTGLLSNPVDLIMTRGEARFQQKKYDLATTDFNTVKASRPADAMPYLYQSMMLYEQGKLDEAVKTGSEALNRNNQLAFPFAIQAEQAYRKNQLTDALNHATAAIQRDPQMELAYRLRGSVLTWQYDLDAAQADLKRALELKPNQAETLAMQAYIHFMRYEDKDLETSVKAAVAASKDSAPALWAQALLSLQNHDEDAANKFMDQAIQLDGTRPEYYLFRTYSYYKTDQEKQALADWDKALQLNPYFAPAIAAKAGYLYGIYMPVDIEAEAQRVLALAPKADLAHLMLADKYRRDREWPKALDAAEKALKAQPGPMSGLLTRADIYMDQHEYDLAAADYQKAAQISPNAISGLIGLSYAQLYKDAYDEAHKTLDQVAKIDPQSLSVHGARAAVYLAQENLAKARKEVEEGLKRDAGSSNLLMMRAMISMRENDNLSALSDVNRVGELFPDDPRIMVMRASVLAANKDTKAALAELQKAEKIDSKLPDIYKNRSYLYLAQNDPTNAITQAKKAVDLNPKDAGSYGLLGEAELQRQKIQDGIEHLKKSIELDPSLRYSYYILGMAQWNQGDVESALANLNKMVGMKGKLDIKLVTDARQVVGFLTKVPVAANGQRTVKDDRLEYTITYPTSWVPRPPTEDDKLGMQFRLTPVEQQDFAVFQVQVIQMLDLNIQEKLTVDMVAEGVLQVSERMCYSYKPGTREAFNGQGEKGLAVSFECTYQDKSQQTFTVMEKIYMFATDKSYVALQFISAPVDFEKYVKAADEIAASFRFTKQK